MDFDTKKTDRKLSEVRVMEYSRDCKINVAGINVLIKRLHDKMPDYFVDYCANFDEPDITVTLSPIETEQTIGDKLGSEFFTENKVYISYNNKEIDKVQILKVMADKVLPLNILLMHGAVVAKENLAYMFLAVSGTGKTTRVRKWLEEYPESVVVNGDKPFIKITESEAYACGSPWCGKEGWNANIIVPIRAFFFIERADGEENSSIEEISLREAFPNLLQQTYRPNDLRSMRKTIELLKALNGKVKFYKFRSKPTREAIRLAYITACPQ